MSKGRQHLSEGAATGDVVIVGGGPVGHRLAERLRRHGHRGTVTLLHAEPVAPYQRALLASVLDGGLRPAALRLPPVPGVRVLPGTTVTAVDRAGRRVRTATSEQHRYDTLVLATGAEPFVPPVPGIRTAAGRLLDGVTTLRSLADCARVGGEQAVVLGGGPLGLETAAALRRSGRDVTVVHRGPYPLDRRLDATAGDLLVRHLSGLGVRLECGRSAVRVEPGKLVLDDGRPLAWDTLVCCTGVRPRAALARAAGLAVRNGVLVDDGLRTGDPWIRAIGDCAEHPGWAPGLPAPGWDQAEVLARSLTGQEPGGRRAGTVLRLRLAGLPLGVLGAAPGSAGNTAERETVTFRDPARGRYATVTVDAAGRLASAVVVGLPEALAALTQLHDAHRPLPADRLSLLLGRAPAVRRAPATSAEPSDVVCRCNDVSRGALARAWHDGARTLRALSGATRATTGCGGCADEIRRLCAQLAAEEPAPGRGPSTDEDEGADDAHDATPHPGDRRLRHDRAPADRGAAVPGPGGRLAHSCPR
ncbi:FAD-dependent oxidoreductase [Streptomyces sp. NPDC056160]|uniref:FAD-dependent oxidoreductase n=1 Tax=Streptomyces sp. NPDC056160 TaxID=3345731 RepID=UPI0035D8685A